MSPAADPAARPFVTAVVVAHNGQPWLPRLTAALADSSRAPDRVIAVDTGSSDGTRADLQEAFGAECVVDAPASSGFGAAVAAALAHTGTTAAGDEWLWLLHDDCLPAAETLAELIAVADSDPRVGVVGCRVRSWPRGTRLLEVGVSIAGTGRRETGLEPGEYDQGQYDEVRDTLAVSSAGMLVRRRDWDHLHGFDPRLPLFRDDVDFGWRAARADIRVVYAPAAVLFHAEAATRGVRTIDNTATRPYRADRRAALFTLLANCSAAAFVFCYVRLLIGSALRILGFCLGKMPGTAYDEAIANASVLGRPWRLWRARRQRRRTAVVNHAAVRRLRPPWWASYAHAIDDLLLRVNHTARKTVTAVSTSTRRFGAGASSTDVLAADALDTGPVADEAVNLPTGDGPVAWVRRHPLFAVTTVLTLCGLVASRGLWGGGFLQGGALPPAPDGVDAWWDLYLASWHTVGLGTTRAAAPYVAMLAVPATILFGKAWLVVDLVMLFGVPLAGLSGYAAACRLVRSKGVRAWMAACYGLLPVLTGAVPSGHLGTVVVAIVFPWVVRAFLPLLWRSTHDGWRPMWRAGALLAVVVAFAPVIWPMAAALAVLTMAVLAVRGPRLRVVQVAGAVALPAALLLPWWLQFLDHPSLMLTEAGRTAPSTFATGSDSWQLLLGRVPGAGGAPWWLTVGILLSAVAALLRRDRRPQVATAWVVVAVAMATAAGMATQVVPVLGTPSSARVWMGVPVVVGQAAAIAAAGLAADGVARSIGARSFGWRQPVGMVLAMVAMLAPVAGVGWWVAQAPQGSLTRTNAVALPAYMTAAMDRGHRVLVVDAAGDPITYQILAGDGLRLGDDSVLPEHESRSLTQVVTDLLAEPSADDVDRLAQQDIAYVVLTKGSDPSYIAAFNGSGGLSQASSSAGMHGWSLDQVAADTNQAQHSPAQASDNRRSWLIAQAVLWALAVVMAAPAIDKHRPGRLQVGRA